MYSHTIENEGFCPCVITDKIHLPSATIPFSVPVVIYVTESRPGIFESSIVRPGRVISDSRVRTEVVEIQIHEGISWFVKVWRGWSYSKVVR